MSLKSNCWAVAAISYRQAEARLTQQAIDMLFSSLLAAMQSSWAV